MLETAQQTILVIDDSLTIRQIVSVGLRREGYRVLDFADAAAALRWLGQDNQLLPALIVLNINLPRLNGYQCALRLKQHAPFARIPILMLSCRGGLLDRPKGRLAGAAAYLTKPFQIQRLVALAQELIEKEKGTQHCHKTTCQ